MKIVKPGDAEFNAPENPFRSVLKNGHAPGPEIHGSAEIQNAMRHLLRSIASAHPNLIPHLAVGGTILIGTHSKAVIELPFSGIAGKI